jgi:hypothetical protein
MEIIMKYFKSTIGFTLAALIIAALFLGGIKAAITVAILAVLEISLSFDNAVVNAKALKDMDPIWKQRFLTWGMVIAVFGMRVLFPLLIVSVVAGISPWSALLMAVKTPDVYATTLTSAHVLVAGFGMAFLMMVFLKFFFDKEKEVHWVGFIEKHLHHLEATEIAVTLGVAYVISTFLPAAEAHQFLVAAIMGLITFILVEWIGEVLEGDGGESATTVVAKTGLGAFIYLEILDASFSFDGVIGAFALTNNIFIIALGLGSGAFAVRGMTLMLVDKGTLSEFRYLEHGAFYAIGVLAALMGVGTFHEVPEIVTGLLGAAFIVMAIISSVVWKRNNLEL